MLAIGIAAGVVVFGYRVMPLYPLRLAGVLLVCIVIFSCLGVALGALIRRTLPVTIADLRPRAPAVSDQRLL